MHHLMIPMIAQDMRRPSHLKGLPVLVTAPEILENRWVISIRSTRRGVDYLLAWLDRSFGVNRRFDDRQLGVVQKPATHRVS